MNPKRATVVYQRLLIVVLLLAAGSSVSAHEWPQGDILPYVRVRDGRFDVYFTNSRFMGSPDHWKWYRTKIAADGKLLENRSSTKKPQFPEELWKVNVGTNWTYSLRRTIKSKDWPSVIEPKWAGHSIGGIDAMTEIGERLVVALSPSESGEKPFPFYFASIDPATGGVIATKIGIPARINDFPVTSNVQVIDGTPYLVWIRVKRPSLNWRELYDGNPKDKFELVLTRCRFDHSGLEHFQVSDGPYWNTAISVNAIRDRLLIAWHTRLGTIETRLLRVSEIEFRNKLP